MSTTYVHEMVHSGAETLNDQLTGTAVASAGPRGKVQVAFIASDGTNTATLKGRRSGKEIIPSGSHACVATEIKGGHFIYVGAVAPMEELDLQVISATASTSVVCVRIE